MNQVLMAEAVSPEPAMVMAPGANAPRTLSPGCSILSEPLTDGFYTGKSYPTMQFVAGEHVTIEAHLPAAFGAETTIILREGSQVVDMASLPGTLGYTIPLSGPYSFNWSANENLTWAVSCSPPQP